MQELRDRIAAKVDVDPDTGCWLWKASLGTKGYGQLYVNSRPIGAHRASYIAHVGPIPDGLHVDHICGRKTCVNPAHLQAITAEENVKLQSLRRSSCPNGHPHRPETTRWYRGYRRCLLCEKRSNLSRRTGRPIGRRPAPLVDRFISRIQRVGACTLWIGGRSSDGYGLFWMEGRNRFAHRVAYELFVGDVGRGCHVQRVCGNQLCVDPEHLRLAAS